MLDVIVACLWVVTAAGAVLLLAAAVGRLPRGVALSVVGVAEAASIVSPSWRRTSAICSRSRSSRRPGSR